MRNKRAPRTPEVNAENVFGFDEAISDAELFRCYHRFLYQEFLRSKELTSEAYIALDVVSALARAKNEGRSDDELKGIWPEEWGNTSVSVPLHIALIIAQLWQCYLDDDFEKSLGEVFGLEGGEQGAHRMKSKLSTLDKHLVLAREVEILYLSSQFDGNHVTQEEAINEIAIKHELSYETVLRAHREQKSFIRKSLMQLGILSG